MTNKSCKIISSKLLAICLVMILSVDDRVLAKTCFSIKESKTMNDYLLFLDLSVWCFLGLDNRHSRASPDLINRCDLDSVTIVSINGSKAFGSISDRLSSDRTHRLRIHYVGNCPMDKLENYRLCIQTLLEKYSQSKSRNEDIDNELFFDYKRDRYLAVALRQKLFTAVPNFMTNPSPNHQINHRQIPSKTNRPDSG
jgi:XisI protein